MARDLVEADAAPGKHARQQLVAAARLRHRQRARFARRVEPRPPRPAGERPLDAEEELRRHSPPLQPANRRAVEAGEIDEPRQRGDPEAGRPIACRRRASGRPRLRRAPEPADSATPTARRREKFCAAAAGPTISVNTSSTPTICAHSAVAIATMARNAAETKRSGTPRASASSACSEAKISGRSDEGERGEARRGHQQQRQQRRIVDAEHVAEQQRRRLRRRRGVEMQEQQAEPERQRQHHADRHVALGELLAEQAHARFRRRG